MCKVQMLRELVERRLNVAVEEIFELFEKTIAEYEEELCRSKEENERQRELLDAVFTPQSGHDKAGLFTFSFFCRAPAILLLDHLTPPPFAKSSGCEFLLFAVGANTSSL